MKTIFRKVSMAERLPAEEGNYVTFSKYHGMQIFSYRQILIGVIYGSNEGKKNVWLDGDLEIVEELHYKTEKEEKRLQSADWLEEIELPTEEKIEHQFNDGKLIQSTKEEFMIEGAKWYRDFVLAVSPFSEKKYCR